MRIQERPEALSPMRAAATAIKRRARPRVIILAALALVCVIFCTVAGVEAFVPVAPGAARQVRFEVVSGDTSRTVGDRLEKAGLIRNATVFTLLARAHGLALEQGGYTLSPDMSADGIVRALQQPPSAPQVTVQVAPG